MNDNKSTSFDPKSRAYLSLLNSQEFAYECRQEEPWRARAAAAADEFEQCGLLRCASLSSLPSSSWRNRSRLGAHTRRLGGITRFYTPDPAFNAPPSDHFLGREGGEENSSRYFEIHEDEMREAWAEWDGTNLC